jgi:hypothetical protein
VNSYIQELMRRSERQQAEQRLLREQEAHLAEQAVRERLVPLEVRLARLLATIPHAVQAEGLSLLTLQAQLRARGRGHTRCHVGELGTALRALHFERRRRWRGDAAIQALWFPNRKDLK